MYEMKYCLFLVWLLSFCTAGPVITSDFPDPAIILVNDTWYAFGTSSSIDNTAVFVQIASSPDFSSWTVLEGQDALASLPDWVNEDDPLVWAPDVVQRKDGMFVLYYTALSNVNGTDKFHCIGTATSTSVTGPFVPTSNEPFTCPISAGGAIDPAGFTDKDGSMYVLWKVDGNAIGHGGSCGNTVAPIVSTPIMIQRVQDDGYTPAADAMQILTNGPEDGPLVEAPSLALALDGSYVLYYSSHCYTDANYDVAYATGDSPVGNFTKAATPLLQNGTAGLIGPGGASIAADGIHVAFHGYLSEADLGGRRVMYVAVINAEANTTCS